MKELFQKATLNSSDKAIIIMLALIVIVLVLVIMYKIDNIPEDYTKRKKIRKREKMYEDFEEEIEEEAAEEKMEKLYKDAEERNDNIFPNYAEENNLDNLEKMINEMEEKLDDIFGNDDDTTLTNEDIDISFIDEIEDDIKTKENTENVEEMSGADVTDSFEEPAIANDKKESKPKAKKTTRKSQTQNSEKEPSTKAKKETTKKTATKKNETTQKKAQSTTTKKTADKKTKKED